MASPALRLFDASANVGAAADELTLCQFFRAHVRPLCLKRAAARNLEQYDESLAYWAAFTGDPPIAAINEETGELFRDKLEALPGLQAGSTLADNTVRKHVTCVQYCLDRAGPKTRKNPLGQGLVDDPPYLPRPAAELKEVEDNFTLKEVGRILDAMGAADVVGSHDRPAVAVGTSRTRGPRRKRQAALPVPPPVWWQAVGEADYNLGFRIGTLLRLRFEWLFEDEWGWWLRLANRAGGKQKKGRDFYVNRWARAAIERMQPRGQAPREGPIFPWPYSAGYIHRALNLSLATAGLPKRRWFGFYGFRKCFATELAKINGLVVPLALGHSLGGRGGKSIALDHYVHREALAAALDKLPQPEWSPAADPQRRLF